MMLLSQAAQVLRGQLVGPDSLYTSVSSDSRAIIPGDLFVALRGPNFDGAGFAAAALRDGAVGALLNADSYPGPDAPGSVLLVPDTRLAMGQLAAHWRLRFELPLIAITGSNGKTTVKEMLASILRAAAGSANAVLATPGNFNNDIGMPLTLLKLRTHHRYAVIEMGMNHSGEIDYLTRLARPDIAVINNASSAHLAGLGTIAAVARAKGEIFAGLPERGIAIINADDAHAPLWRMLARDHRIVDFGLNHSAAVQGRWQPQDFGARLQVSTPDGGFTAQLQVPGIHNARNALAAAAAAAALEIAAAHIVTGLENFSGVAGRLQRKQARCGAALLDDTYNANPASLHSALEVLAQAGGKKILVLGDMGELGDDAVRLHSEIGAEARRLGIDKLLALGKLSMHSAQGYGAGAHHYLQLTDLLDALDRELGVNVTVLVKGSRFMRMERVVQHCLGTSDSKPEQGLPDLRPSAPAPDGAPDPCY
jgi:UDP-N-acetylmuramoyl-tripeptide--D-alanyl-D-alanine ligase